MSGEQAQASTSPFVPALLLVVAVLSWNSFQCLQLVNERTSLESAISGQEPQMEQSQKVRAALDSLARRTARLARLGNANATIVVENLRRRGIAIDPDGPAAEKAPEAATAPTP